MKKRVKTLLSIVAKRLNRSKKGVEKDITPKKKKKKLVARPSVKMYIAGPPTLCPRCGHPYGATGRSCLHCFVLDNERKRRQKRPDPRRFGHSPHYSHD